MTRDSFFTSREGHSEDDTTGGEALRSLGDAGPMSVKMTKALSLKSSFVQQIPELAQVFVDLSPIAWGDGYHMPVVEHFKYLGSYLSRDCTDNHDVDSRIESAGKAFGALREMPFQLQHCLLCC